MGFFSLCVPIDLKCMESTENKEIYYKLLPTTCKMLSGDIRVSKTFHAFLLWDIEKKKFYRDQETVCNN